MTSANVLRRLSCWDEVVDIVRRKEILENVMKNKSLPTN
jgi:hypothetical protein